MKHNDINVDEISNTTKLLLYKQSPNITSQLNFENSDTFLEPLLFAFFNSPTYSENGEALLKELMQGYFANPTSLQLQYLYNNSNIAYIPNKGYYNRHKKLIEAPYYLDQNKTIELIKTYTPLLSPIFRDKNEQPLDPKLVEMDKALFLKNKADLKNAVQCIEKTSPSHFKLIQKCCSKLCVFKADPKHTNSFASNNVLGMAFLNAYQDDYGEAFFVDDIAHQSGHAIMFMFWFNKQEHFILDPNAPLAPILENPKEYRSFYVLFHALYTYYTSTLCLDNCITANVFNDKEKQEALARIGFYLNKYKYDLVCFEKFCAHYKGVVQVIKEPSIQLYATIKEQYIKMIREYGDIVKDYTYTNQPYNFTFSNFIEVNLKN
ncbi:hypothetical protein ULMA_15930 [Patiriisocius marinus]|uniref:Uncharacterized protein n=1 Tax=Patiriisocius marinus TaxID=1397112 RepID=A0A5J4IP97_9FLAO|nr:hypothetical protein [Patiriisocius marinus]GER59485.1 hypothetical protein ULMA_15930 [Patiriisocius marinus]